jgi:regulator of nucleoside diphosphate kinase
MRNLEQDNIIITKTDLQRLLPVLDHHNSEATESLAGELYRAIVVEPDAVPADVVTMNSDVVYEDCATLAKRTVRLVYPKDADGARGFVSVLAPIGSALLGMRVNQTIEWSVPSGTKRIRVLEVRYQPEAAGHFDL